MEFIKKPQRHVWLARHRYTKELVFINTGESYDQGLYDLLFSVSAEEVHTKILKLAGV